MRLRPVLFAICAIALPLQLHGQAVDMSSDGEEVDRVAAVVGDSAIFYSEVLDLLQQRRAVLQAQGQDIPTDPDGRRALELELLDDLVQHQLLVQAAVRDTTLVVTDDQVERAFNQAWQQRVQQFQGEANLHAAIEQRGESVSGFRAALRNQTRQEILIGQFVQMQQRDARPVAVDESEIQEFYEQERASLPPRPASVSFRQAVVQPTPTPEDMEAAVAEAERILELLDEGESFADLARRFSEDPGSRQQGGELGWFRRGSDLDPDFEDAAFSLREGQISRPVETSFGAHIIRVSRIRGPERMIHHILIGAEGDREGARERAEAIRDAVEAGTPMREFTRETSQMIPDSMEVGLDQLDEYPSAYAAALRTASPGDVIGPVELPLDEEGGQVVWVVLQVLEVREAGELTLDDLRGQIREFLRTRKMEARLMDRLRARTHVEVRI